VIRRILVALVASVGVVAVAGPTSAKEPAEPVGPVATEHPGDPCCDAKWCVGQEGACTAQCGKYKRGSAKWTECNKYCSQALSRCTSCCRTYRVPNCNHYCFDG
jgi:hypothetical protein